MSWFFLEAEAGKNSNSSRSFKAANDSSSLYWTLWFTDLTAEEGSLFSPSEAHSALSDATKANSQPGGLDQLQFCSSKSCV